MGDYVHASIKIGGHLETVEQAEQLLEALTSDFGDGDRNLTWMRESVETNTPMEHEEDQVHYGSFDATESAVLSISTLASITVFNSGDDFDSGSKTIYEGTEHDFTGTAMMDRDRLELAIEDGIESVRKMVEAHKFLERNCVTGFTASPAVAAWLKIFGEKAA